MSSGWMKQSTAGTGRGGGIRKYSSYVILLVISPRGQAAQLYLWNLNEAVELSLQKKCHENTVKIKDLLNVITFHPRHKGLSQVSAGCLVGWWGHILFHWFLLKLEPGFGPFKSCNKTLPSLSSLRPRNITVNQTIPI